MRKAIIDKLKEISELKEVYQPFLAPSGAAKPYASVKLTTTLNAVGNRAGWFQPVEVYIYNSRTSFITIDTLVSKVIEKLDGVALETGSGAKFTCELDGIISDADSDTQDALFKIVTFNIPKYKP